MAVLQKAEALADQEKFEEAGALCAGVLASEPENAAALNLRGFCLARLGRPAEALPFFKRARLHLPIYAIIRYNLAVALEETGDLPGAVEEYSEALRLESGMAAAQEGLTRAREAIKRDGG